MKGYDKLVGYYYPELQPTTQTKRLYGRDGELEYLRSKCTAEGQERSVIVIEVTAQSVLIRIGLTLSTHTGREWNRKDAFTEQPPQLLHRGTSGSGAD